MKSLVILLLALCSFHLSAEECSKTLIKSLFERPITLYHRKILQDWSCSTTFRGDLYAKVSIYLKETGQSEVTCNQQILSINELLGLVDEEARENFLECKEDGLTCLVEEDFTGFLSLKVINHRDADINIDSIQLGSLSFIDGSSPKNLAKGINEWILLNDHQVAEQLIVVKTPQKSCDVFYRRPPLHPNSRVVKKCATVFEHVSYQGRSLVLYDSLSPQMTLKVHPTMNNMISSATVTPGCSLKLYVHDAFNGPQVTLKASQENFVYFEGGRFQDNISSLECSCE